MGRKAPVAKPVKTATKVVKTVPLKLAEILDAASFVHKSAEVQLPPGFSRYDTKKPGKVSPFTKAKKGGATSYDYPKGSPIKFVQNKKEKAAQVKADLAEATKTGVAQWAEVNVPKQVVKHAKKTVANLGKSK